MRSMLWSPQEIRDDKMTDVYTLRSVANLHFSASQSKYQPYFTGSCKLAKKAPIGTSYGRSEDETPASWISQPGYHALQQSKAYRKRYKEAHLS